MNMEHHIINHLWARECVASPNTKYIKEILKKFGNEDSKTVGTLMCIGFKLTKDDDSKEVDQTLYRSMVGKL